MARFGFAVPGRRKQDTPPVAAPQLTKAQKILGTSLTNIDASTVPVLSLPSTLSQPMGLPELSPTRFSYSQTQNYAQPYNQSHNQSRTQSHTHLHANDTHIAYNTPNWDAQSATNTCISINISEGSLGLSSIYEDMLDGTTSNAGLTDSNTATHSTTSRSHAGHAGHAASSRRPPPPSEFGAESGVLPRKFFAPSGRGAESQHDLHGTYDNDLLDDRETLSITDASSVRRKLSASTMTSYYDKSKVPLNISQQTSSSAMAKGLPTKAQALLDVDNSISQASKTAKKRPSKLGLTRMFSSSSSDKGTSRSDRSDSHRKKSEPNVSSKLRKTMPATGMAENDRARAQAQAAVALKEARRSSARSDKGKTSNNNHRATALSQEAAGLQNLYEHYEQMTFRDVFAEAEADAEVEAKAEAAEAAAIAAAHADAARVRNEEELCATEDGDAYDTERPEDGEGMLAEERNAHNAHDRGYANYPVAVDYAQHSAAYSQQHVTRSATSDRDIAAYLGGYGSTEALQQAEALNSLSLLPDPPRNQHQNQNQNQHQHQKPGNVYSQSSLLPPGDCSDSISSRHTRTSRASKHTSLSLLELDLQQNSILSLSSDSEDDEYSARPKTSSSGDDDHNDGNIGTEVQQPQQPQQQHQAPQLPPLFPATDRQSLTTLPTSVYSGHGRSSRNSNSTTSTARPPPLRDTWTQASSRESTMSVSSTRTGTSGRSGRSGRTILSNDTATESGRYTVHEARAITLVPAQGAAYNRNSRTATKDGLSPSARPLSTLTSASGTDRLSPLPSPGFPSAPSPTGSAAAVNDITVVSARGFLTAPDVPVAAAPPPPNVPPPAIPEAVSQPPLATTQTVHTPQTARPMQPSPSAQTTAPQPRQSPPSPPSPPPPQPHSQQPTPSQSGQGRFMAVTRQEEALLAAFRKKRIRMRDSIIAEFADGPDLDEDDAAPTPTDEQPKAELRRSSNGSGLELHAPQPRSASRASFTLQPPPQPPLPMWSSSPVLQPPRPASQASAAPSTSQASIPIAATRPSSVASIHPPPSIMQFEDSAFPVPPSPAIRHSLSLRSSSVSSATRRTSLSLFPPTASASRQLSPGLPSPGLPSPGFRPPPSPGLAPRFSMVWNEPLSPRSKPPTMSLPAPPPPSSRSRFSEPLEPLSPRSVPSGAMTLPPLATISEPCDRLAIVDTPLSPRSPLPTTARRKATAKNADLDRVLTQLDSAHKERRESTSACGSLTESTASGSHSGATSGTASASGSDASPSRSDDGRSQTGPGRGMGIDSFPAVPSHRLSNTGAPVAASVSSSSATSSGPLPPSSSSFGSFSSFSLTAPRPRKKRPLPPPLVMSMGYNQKTSQKTSRNTNQNMSQNHGPYSPFSAKASPLPTHDEEGAPSFSEIVATALEAVAVEGIPRPDSPLESPLPLPFKRNVRISAVGGPVGASAYTGSRRGSQASHAGQGRVSIETSWWPDDG